MADSSKSNVSRPQDNEPQEPGDMVHNVAGGLESPPIWMWLLVFVALFAGVYFLGANLGMGGLGTAPWPQGGDIPAVAVAETPAIDGGAIYTNRCIACHQSGGSGVPGVFPPLANSEWVTGNADLVTRVVLHGLQDPIEVAGTSYNGVMPGLAAQMPDDEIAAVVSHVRTSFGNNASTVTAADVARVRAETDGRSTPWTAPELADLMGSSPAPSNPAPAAATPAPVAATPVVAASSGSGGSGAALFEQYACNTCHAVDGPTALVGPSLYDAGSRLSKAELYEAIVDPDATITDGYTPGIMSAMVSTMNFSTSELNKMVEYLESLKG